MVFLWFSYVFPMEIALNFGVSAKKRRAWNDSLLSEVLEQPVASRGVVAPQKALLSTCRYDGLMVVWPDAPFSYGHKNQLFMVNSAKSWLIVANIVINDG